MSDRRLQMRTGKQTMMALLLLLSGASGCASSGGAGQ